MIAHRDSASGNALCTERLKVTKAAQQWSTDERHQRSQRQMSHQCLFDEEIKWNCLWPIIQATSIRAKKNEPRAKSSFFFARELSYTSKSPSS